MQIFCCFILESGYRLKTIEIGDGQIFREKWGFLKFALYSIEKDQMCKNSPSRLNNDDSLFFRLYNPTDNVASVELTFRERFWLQIFDNQLKNVQIEKFSRYKPIRNYF